MKSLLDHVKDSSLIYMPSDRAVIKPRRLWDGVSLNTSQPGIGGIPFTQDVFCGIGCVEFHNCEHWQEGRYLLPTAFSYQVYTEANDCIELRFNKEGHLFKPHVLHSEFSFSDNSDTISQDIAAVDDIFACRLMFRHSTAYNVVTMTGRPWFDFRVERLDRMILYHTLSGPHVGTYIAFHAAFAPESSKAVLTGVPYLACQFQGKVENSSYLLLGIDDNRQRLIERMQRRIGNPESVFTDAKAEWEQYYAQCVPPSSRKDPLWERATAWTAYYIKSSLLSHNKHGSIPPYTVGCGKGFFTGCPVENTQYHIIGEVHLKDSSIVESELKPRLNQEAGWSMELESHSSHYLFNAYIHRLIYRKFKNRESMKTGLTVIENTLKTVSKIHDKGDGLYWTNSHLETPMGFDNSSRWDKAYSKIIPFEWKNNLQFGVKAVEASSFVVEAAATAAYFSNELGLTAKASYYQKYAEDVGRNIRIKHWDDNRKFFVDLIGPDDERSDILSLAGVAPLWAGVATPEQAHCVAEALYDPMIFRSPYGPTSHAKNSPAYGDYWRGDVCMRLNWLAYFGLKRYGFHEIASWILESTLLRADKYNYDGAEMWNPGTGIGYYCQSAEMGLLLDMMIYEERSSSSLTDKGFQTEIDTVEVGENKY